jgi:hypothetical protein
MLRGHHNTIWKLRRSAPLTLGQDYLSKSNIAGLSKHRGIVSVGLRVHSFRFAVT